MSAESEARWVARMEAHAPQILRLRAQGRTNRDIARETGLPWHALNRILSMLLHAGRMQPGSTGGRPSDETAPRRARVAALLAEGHSHAEIARRCGIAPGTVRSDIARHKARQASAREQDDARDADARPGRATVIRTRGACRIEVTADTPAQAARLADAIATATPPTPDPRWRAQLPRLKHVGFGSREECTA